MSSAKLQIQALLEGKKDLKPIPLAWFVTSEDLRDPPQLIPDYDMPQTSGRGFTRLSQEQAVERLKKIVPIKGGISREMLGSAEWKRSIGQGESLYNWYLKQSESNETKQMLTTGNAFSQNYVLLNGVFSDKNSAAQSLNATPEELKRDLATMGKIQAEKESETKRLSEIKTLESQGKPVSKELLAPGIGAGTGSAGYQVGQSGQEAPQKSPSHVGESTKIIPQPEGKFSVVGADTGKVYAQDLKTVVTALAAQNQITGGSTPSLSDVPEVYAQPPTKAEISAGIQPIMGSKGKMVIPVVAVNPELALKVEQTSDTLKANKEFVNAVVEAYTGSPATPEQLKELVGKKTGDVKNEVKQSTPINQQINEQVKSVFGEDVSKLKPKDVADIAAKAVVPKPVEEKFPQMFNQPSSPPPPPPQQPPSVQQPPAPPQTKPVVNPAEETITKAAETSVQNKEANAKASNPTLVITPEMRSIWLQEALDELRQNRGISEIIRNAEFDLGQSLNRLIEDVKFRELDTLNKFRQDFRNMQVSQRERGFLYGGIREQEEKQLADVTNLSLAGQGRTLERGVQDVSQGFERQFGTAPSAFGSQGALGAASRLGSVQGVSRVIPGSPIIKAGQPTPGFTISGGQYGSFNRELEEEARRRAEEKQSAFETQFSLARTF